ncbi:M20 family metallo-hydrolase [Mesorhizobium sp. BAC0120]|uniref:M20 family metallo-hydrolase n=1 Tax=Mesorhizobium sp. BAC0120 TaxID=3090670 RepID=UPI00298C5A77|nr:M20 family metallo-hydrolase [Mesorhizobium sp. BAC0120]MDW6023376.1 M20 family metallo-hydrolase [Mesorhizobium sp. BAC0120]
MNEAAALRADFDALAEIGRRPEGGWARPAFSPADCAAHDWFLERARLAGLSARYDAFGNAVARLGADNRPAIVLGSHLDTVVGGGAFDGALGVLAGLDVARRLVASGDVDTPVEVVAFRDEEGRFGPFTGSRAFTGTLPLGTIDKLRDADGVSLVEAMRMAGFDPAAAAEAARDPAGISAYLELHIEQGPVLEEQGLPLGIVTAIAGQERLAVRFVGRSDHAGTAPMNLRRDAFAATARFADRFRDLVLADESKTLRGTVGIVNLLPNQGNVVPGEVRLGLEIRDIDQAAVERTARATEKLAVEVAEQFGCELKCRSIHKDAPVPMDTGLRGALEASARELGAASMALPSGANHDAGVMGRFVPSAMLFVPSRDGRSHCPEEHTDWQPIALATDVLEATVRRLAATSRAA